MYKSIKELDIFISDGNYSSKYPRSEEFVDEGVPFIRGNNMIDGEIVDEDMYHITEEKHGFLLKGHVQPGDVLITTRGNIGQVAIVPESHNDSNINAQIVLLRVNKEELYNRYLLWALQSHKAKEQYLSLQTGTALKQLPVGKLEQVKIKYVDLMSQVQIAEILDKAYRVIKMRKNELMSLDALIKARFIELFGLVGNDEKGWGLTRLGDCCVINPKKSNDARLCADLDVSFVPMPAVSEKGEMDASEIKSYNDVKSGFTYFAEKDVLFAKITPCMENGKGAVAKGLCNGIGFGSTEFHVLRPIGGISNPYWIYTVTAFKQFRNDAANNMTGSAGQRRVPASFLENYRVSVPPIELQEQFATFVEQTDKSKFIENKQFDFIKILFYMYIITKEKRRYERS